MFRSLDLAEEWIAKGFLAACVILVFVASLARWAGHPIIWSVDIAQLLFAWSSFLGADQALRHREHMAVDLLVRYLPDGARRKLELVLWGVMGAFLVAVIWYGTQLTLLNVERRFSDTPLSYATVTASVPVGCLLMLITVLRHLVTDIRAWAADRQGGKRGNGNGKGNGPGVEGSDTGLEDAA